jgi:hypothetical protein
MKQVSTYFIVDNRSAGYQNFRSEAANWSYHHNVLTLLRKFVSLSFQHKWIKLPVSIAVAKSPLTTVAIENVVDICKSAAAYESIFSCIHTAHMSRDTWGVYLTDALSSVLNRLERTKTLTSNDVKKQSNLIVIFVPDVYVMSNGSSNDSDEGIKKFFAVARKIIENSKSKIRIVSPILSESGMDLLDDMGLIHVFANITDDLKSSISFENIVNSPPNFDEELRSILGLCFEPITLKLDFALTDQANCSLYVNLRPSTCSAGDAVHNGLRYPVIISLCRRSEINATFIQGCGLHAACPVYNLVRPFPGLPSPLR